MDSITTKEAKIDEAAAETLKLMVDVNIGRPTWCMDEKETLGDEGGEGSIGVETPITQMAREVLTMKFLKKAPSAEIIHRYIRLSDMFKENRERKEFSLSHMVINNPPDISRVGLVERLVPPNPNEGKLYVPSLDSLEGIKPESQFTTAASSKGQLHLHGDTDENPFIMQKKKIFSESYKHLPISQGKREKENLEERGAEIALKRYSTIQAMKATHLGEWRSKDIPVDPFSYTPPKSPAVIPIPHRISTIPAPHIREHLIKRLSTDSEIFRYRKNNRPRTCNQNEEKELIDFEGMRNPKHRQTERAKMTPISSCSLKTSNLTTPRLSDGNTLTPPSEKNIPLRGYEHSDKYGGYYNSCAHQNMHIHKLSPAHNINSGKCVVHSRSAKQFGNGIISTQNTRKNNLNLNYKAMHNIAGNKQKILNDFMHYENAINATIRNKAKSPCLVDYERSVEKTIRKIPIAPIDRMLIVEQMRKDKGIKKMSMVDKLINKIIGPPGTKETLPPQWGGLVKENTVNDLVFTHNRFKRKYRDVLYRTKNIYQECFLEKKE